MRAASRRRVASEERVPAVGHFARHGRERRHQGLSFVASVQRAQGRPALALTAAAKSHGLPCYTGP